MVVAAKAAAAGPVDHQQVASAEKTAEVAEELGAVVTVALEMEEAVEPNRAHRDLDSAGVVRGRGVVEVGLMVVVVAATDSVVLGLHPEEMVASWGAEVTVASEMEEAVAPNQVDAGLDWEEVVMDRAGEEEGSMVAAVEGTD